MTEKFILRRTYAKHQSRLQTLEAGGQARLQTPEAGGQARLQSPKAGGQARLQTRKSEPTQRKRLAQRVGISLLAILLAGALFPLGYAFGTGAFSGFGPAAGTTGAAGTAAGAAAGGGAGGTGFSVSTLTDSSAGLRVSPDVVTSATVLAREEVIYGNLSALGRVEGLYAVTTVTTGSAGLIRESGSFSQVTNLTNSVGITRSSEGMSVITDAGAFTYQGNLTTTKLPWVFTIGYTLDGRMITPEDLAGSTGALELTIDVKLAEGSEGSEGADAVFTDNYMLQITVTLDSAKARDVFSDTASIVLAGGSRTVSFTVLPGRDAINSFTANVSDFELAPIEIIAIPFSMAFDMPDTTGFVGEFQDLLDAIALLNEGATELESGAASLGDGAQSLVSASSVINEALRLMSAGFAGAGSFDIAQLGQLPGVLNELADGLDAAAAALADLAPGYHSALEGLEILINSLPDGSPELDALVYAYFLANMNDPAVQAMYASYAAGTALKANYLGGMQQAFTAADAALGQLPASLAASASGLRLIASQLPDEQTAAAFAEQLASLEYGLATLASTYGDFHTGIVNLSYGLSSYSKGVISYSNGISSLQLETSDLPVRVQEQILAFMASYQPADFSPVSFISADNTNTKSTQFILRTAAIEKLKPFEPPAVLEDEPSFLDRLLALFNF